MIDRAALPLPVDVRLCTREDLEGLEWFGTFRHHREIFAQAYAAQERGENLMLVADVHGFPVGQLWIDLVKRAEARAGLLWAARVFPLFQNLGIGTLLVQAAEKVLVQRQFAAAEIGVEKDNTAARRLYERLGYHVTGELHETYAYTTPDGQPVTHMVDQWSLRKVLSRPAADGGVSGE